MGRVKKKVIKVGILGVGNCASALIQGVEKYKTEKKVTSITNKKKICGYSLSDIKFSLALDIDKRKVGKPLSKAILAPPNNTVNIIKHGIKKVDNVTVHMGVALDKNINKLSDYNEFGVKVAKDPQPNEHVLTDLIRSHNIDVLINLLPVGSQKSTEFYANCALRAGVGFINCIPVFIASDPEWEKKFKKAKLPIIGDDIQSQFGATACHRALVSMLESRGVKIKNTYQLNVGGNSDFYNMLDRNKLRNKKISKTEAVSSQIRNGINEKDIHVGPSDFVPWLDDNKTCFIKIHSEIFGSVPIDLDLKLNVVDSPNSAGVIVDAIRICKGALDKNIGGALYEPCSHLMKRPPIHNNASSAKINFDHYIEALDGDTL